MSLSHRVRMGTVEKWRLMTYFDLLVARIVVFLRPMSDVCTPHCIPPSFLAAKKASPASTSKKGVPAKKKAAGSDDEDEDDGECDGVCSGRG